MRNALVICLVSAVALADVVLKNHGAPVGPVVTLDCVGSGVACSRTGSTGYITVNVGDGGSVDAGSSSSPSAVPVLPRQWGSLTHTSQATSGWTASGALALLGESGSVSGVFRDDGSATHYDCTAAVPGNCGIADTNRDQFMFRQGPKVGVVFGWPTATANTRARMWVALTHSTSALATADVPASTDFVGVRFTQGVDTNWQCCSGAALGSASCSDTGIAPIYGATVAGNALGGLQTVIVDYSDAGVLLASINGVSACAKVSDLPGALGYPAGTGGVMVRMSQRLLADGGTPTFLPSLDVVTLQLEHN